MAMRSTVIERGVAGKKSGVQSMPSGAAAQQARTRVELGKEMLEAAQAYSVRQAAAVEALRAEQGALRDEVEQEVTRSLRSYDQSLGALEKRLVERVEAAERSMEQSAKALEDQWREAHGVMSEMVRRAEALLDQSRVMLEGAKQSADAAARRGVSTPGSQVKRAEKPKATTRPSNGDNLSSKSMALSAPVSKPVAENRERPLTEQDGSETGPTPLIYTRAVEMLRSAPKQEA